MAGATNRALKSAGLPKSTIKTLRVGALGEGGPRATGEHRKFTFKARLLKGKGEGGKDMVAINLIGGGKQRQAQAERAQQIQSDAALPGRVMGAVESRIKAGVKPVRVVR